MGRAGITRRPPIPLLAAAVASGTLLVSCAGPVASGSRPDAPAGAQAAPVASSRALPPSLACCTAPLAERAARTLVVGLPDTLSPADTLAWLVPRLHVRGILLTARNVRSTGQVHTLTRALRAASGGPLLLTIDEEGGRVSSLAPIVGSTPSARLQGTVGAASAQQRATVLAASLRGLGLTSDLAPVADADGGPAGGAIGDRSYAGTPTAAGADALAVARALASGGITPAIKHFPGLGRAAGDTHLSDPIVQADLASLARTDLRPFVDAVLAGAPLVMLGHAEYPAFGDDLPASMSPAAYRLLRSVGFTGVAMTDSIGVGAVNTRFDYPEAAVRALVAGADAVPATDGRETVRMRDAIVAAVRSGRLPEARLDEAAARVARLGGGDPIRLTCRDAVLPSLLATPTRARSAGRAQPPAEPARRQP